MAIQPTQEQRNAARTAAIAMLVSFAIVAVGFYGLYAPLLVHGSAAATAINILANQQRFRLSIAFDVVYAAGLIVVAVAYYRFVESVGRGVALASAVLRAVYALMWLAIAQHLLAALRLLSEPISPDTGIGQAQGLARLALIGASDCYYLGLPFYGLASLAGALLLYRSKYVPRALAWFGIAASAWAAVSGTIYLAVPQFGTVLTLYSLDTPLAFFEMTLSIWILVFGLRPTPRV